MTNPNDIMPTPDLLSGTQIFMEQAQQGMGVCFRGQQPFWSDEIRELRQTLLAEEYKEYLQAEEGDDIIEIVDGLIDVIVIAWGTLLAYIGPDLAKLAAAEVVRSNLAKVIGPGLPLFREDGKVIKPEGWTPPDIAGVLGL